jgi:hypothetical protein
LLNRKGQQGNVYQAHQRGRWDPRSPAYGRFWIDIPDGERERRTVSLGLCATQWVARLRLREYIERAGVNPKRAFHQNLAPGRTFRQQAEWWMDSLRASTEATETRDNLWMATLLGPMDSPECCRRTIVERGEWCLAPIRGDPVRSRARTENDRQRGYCSEVRCRFSGRRGRRPTPPTCLKPRIHPTTLGH